MERTRETQNKRILKYMKDFGSINPMQALRDLAVMRLASRISELKDMGYNVETTLICGVNRYGEPVRYAEYRLKESA